MPLDPNTKALLDQMEALGAPPVWKLEVDQARASMNAMVAMMGPGEDVAEVSDRTIDAAGQELPVRIYRPAGVGAGPAPALVFYHGGGFVIGGLDTHDRDCRALANRGAVRRDRRRLPAGPRAPVPGRRRRRRGGAAVGRRARRRARRRRRPPRRRRRLGRRQPRRGHRPVGPRRGDRAALAAAHLPGRRLDGRLPVEGRERQRLPARPGVGGVVHRALLRTRRQP